MQVFLGRYFEPGSFRGHCIVADFHGREGVRSLAVCLISQVQSCVHIVERNLGARNKFARTVSHDTGDGSLVNLGQCRTREQNPTKAHNG